MTFKTAEMTFGASEKNDTLYNFVQYYFFIKLNIGVKNYHEIPTEPHLLTYDVALLLVNPTLETLTYFCIYDAETNFCFNLK